MVTSPAPNTTHVARPLRGTPSGPRHTERAERAERAEHSDQRSTTGSQVGIVVRLELPDVDGDGRQHSDHSGSATVRSSRPAHTLDHGLDHGQVRDIQLDSGRIALAVEELIRALAPMVSAHVRVEVTPGARVLPPSRPPTAVPGLVSSARSPDRPAGVELDLRARALRVDGAPTALTRREFDLLAYLYQRPAVAFSRADLMTAVWRTAYHEGDRTVDVHIRRIRMKLGRHAHRLSTLRGYGYCLD
jgi:hypothetical protein